MTAGETRPDPTTPATPARVLIADDEALVRAMLRAALEEEPGVDVVRECGSGTEALGAIASLRPDVVFLDIRMPGLTGLEVAAQLTADDAPLVVFVTAYDAHAVHAFELGALDYLLKPFDAERVQATMRRVRPRLHARAMERSRDVAGAGEVAQTIDAVRQLLARSEGAAQDRFVVTMHGRLRVIPAADVDWIEADDNYVRLHTAAGSVLLRETLKSLEARLDPRDFVRVHRSALVRIARVRELRPTPNGDYTVHLTSGAVVGMSRNHRDAVLRRLGRTP